MSNNQLPAEVQERIKADAAKAYPLTTGNDLETGKRMGYIAGATAYATKLHEAQQENAYLKKECERLSEVIFKLNPRKRSDIDDL